MVSIDSALKNLWKTMPVEPVLHSKDVNKINLSMTKQFDVK